ncbi:MAG: hypothetical protein LBM97_01620 [Candidatus Nomurabacteria bacterium]|jgi:hypothetical protein|nr:hypothetical protein [Candidatus Nomurabacteria bacterium]
MDNKNANQPQQDTVNQYGHQKLEQFQKFSVILILIAVLLLVVLGIFQKAMGKDAGADPDFFTEETLALANQDALSSTDMPQETIAVLYRRIRDFVMSDAEKSTAPHANQPQSNMPANYFTATINRDSLRQITDNQYQFSITITDGRQYRITFSLSEDKTELLSAQITKN